MLRIIIHRDSSSYLILWVLSFVYMVLGGLRFPWLILDFFSLFLIVRHLYLISIKGKVVISTIFGFFIGVFLVLILLINILINGLEFISIIKLWDTFKYVPIFSFFSKIFKSNNFRFAKFYNRYYTYLTILFVLNHVLIFFQIYSGVEYDFSTGTFRGESSHTIGFFWVLLMLMQINKKHDFIFLISSISSIVLSILVDNNSAIYMIFILICYLIFQRLKKFDFIRIVKITAISILFRSKRKKFQTVLTMSISKHFAMKNWS